jgi:predicted GIY-YIG superfamily endonuclease
MCHSHEFKFDVDRAYEDQLAVALTDSPKHPLTDPQAPTISGVYVLYREERAVYVGQVRNLRNRLREHRRKIEGRQNIEVAEIFCGFLTIERMWEVSRAEDALINRLTPEWNGITGFGSHPPGSGRPGMPGYVSEWDRRYPPIH